MSSPSEILEEIEKCTQVGTRITSHIADWCANFRIWRGNNSFMKGVIRDGDKLIYEEEFRHSESGRAGDAKIYELDFKKSSTPENFSVITGFIYRDYWIDSTGAVGEVIAGGVNQNYLKFRVTPQYKLGVFPRGCHSKLMIFGK